MTTWVATTNPASEKTVRRMVDKGGFRA
jgi:hypothetical protein